jgi:hypothetical protein
VEGNPISHADPLGLATFQIGISGGVSFGPIQWIGGFGIAVDTEGNVGGYAYTGGGAGLGAGASAGVSVGASSGKTICDLGGIFANASADVGAGPDVGGEVFTGYGEDGVTPVLGGSVTFGAGAGGYVGVTDTGVAKW